MPEKVNEITFKKILLLFIFIGLGASVVNFIHNRSLWLDEAMLSLNIVNRTYLGLLHPLGMNQMAPVGFLLIEKFIGHFFNYTDWSLRLFPFLSYLVSVPLFYFICKLLFSDSKKALLAVAFFCTNLTVLYYSFEVKQYSTDVMVALMISMSSIYYIKNKNNKALLLAILTGVLSVWISNAAVVMLFVFGLAILYDDYKVRSLIGLMVVLIWLTSFMFCYYIFLYHHPTQDYMLMYWSRKKAFLPYNFFTTEFYTFILSKTKMFFTDLLCKNMVGFIFLPIYFSGIIAIRKNKRLLFILLMPLVIHLVLSSLQLYPFDTRLILYQIPFFIITLVEGIFFLQDYFNKRFINTSLYVILLPLLLLTFFVVKAVPIENEEMKKNLDFIDAHIQPKDNVYVYGSASSAFKFYLKRYPSLNNNGVIVYGNFHRDDWSQYDNEVLNLKGRIWLVFSQVYHLNGKNEEDYIVNVLKGNGYKVLSIKKSTGTSCYEVIK